MTSTEPTPACLCGCTRAEGAKTHAIAAALAADDVDRALELGLLDDVTCAACTPACQAQVRAARDARVRALAARDRYRAREARLQRRQRERDRQREAPRAPAAAASETVPAKPALPSAAAAALARARAKAADRHKP